MKDRVFLVEFTLRQLIITIVIAGLLLIVLLTHYTIKPIESGIRPIGSSKDITTRLLELGSMLLQDNKPLNNTNIYLVAFHPMKNNPAEQMEAHHYCKQVNEDFAQCILFDGNTKSANLTGIEYIISEKLFNKLPIEERQYWHSHQYEIISGQLIAPHLPPFAEKKLMLKKLNSYGKTWHFWMTGGINIQPEPLPYGEAMLAWSFNHDNQISPLLIDKRDKGLGINSKEKRKERLALVPYISKH